MMAEVQNLQQFHAFAVAFHVDVRHTRTKVLRHLSCTDNSLLQLPAFQQPVGMRGPGVDGACEWTTSETMEVRGQGLARSVAVLSISTSTHTDSRVAQRSRNTAEALLPVFL